MHPLIRSAEACYLSSSRAIALARKHGARLHILHISTAREIPLFDAQQPLVDKKVTAEACIHHLWFSDADYARLGTRIKWNPAVKTAADRDAVLAGLLDDHIDVLATDHAPHTLEEKSQPYTRCPSGGPLVQHALVALLELYHRGRIPLEKVVEKACHAPAVLYRVKDRGFVREGYAADLVLVDLDRPWTVDRASLLAKCGWSPFEGTTFRARVMRTYVNGLLAYSDGRIREAGPGQRLQFDRPS
jgi:dihydroorotase